jgi:uncharacterized protein
MKINVKRLPPEGEDFSGAETGTIIEVDEPDVHFLHPVDYELHAEIRGRELLVTGRLATTATLRCGRCLRMFEQQLAVPAFVHAAELTGEDFVDLTPSLREDIILELPQRALCADTCRGLCPICGTDRNTQPCHCKAPAAESRWQALDQVKLK